MTEISDHAHDGANPRAVWQPPVGPETYGYRSPDALATAGRCLLIACCLIAAAGAVTSVVEYRLTNALDFVTTRVVHADDARVVLAGFGSLAYLVTAVLFILWTRRVYRNLEPLGASLRFKKGWAVGGWFVPFLNVVRPKQILDDVWRGTDPERNASTTGGVSPLLHWWWAAFISANVLAQVAMLQPSNDSVERLRTYLAWVTASDIVTVAAGVLAFFVVARVTRREALLADSLTPNVERTFDDWYRPEDN